MSQHHANQSSFDKNLRSLLDAIAMFEREAGLVLDRFGLDADAVSRAVDLLGSFSVEVVRPLAAALGIADAASVESLARDVRALLQSDARLRREQAATASRLDDLVAAIEALGATTAGLADLQAHTQERLDGLAERAAAGDSTKEQRLRLFDEVAALRARIDDLESALARGIGASADAADAVPADEGGGAVTGIRPGGLRRAAARTVKTAAGTHKILEGLPTLEPKVRPA